MVTGPPGPSGGGPRGDTGPEGLKGQDGSCTETGSCLSGGVTYTRWGISSCSTEDNALLYAGRAGGSYLNHIGGASNYLCMPNVPLYQLPHRPGEQGRSSVYRVKYSDPVITSRQDHNAPCAVCYVPDKTVVVMIPATTECPTGWTREYYGYLMSENIIHTRTEFVCVDRAMETIFNSQNPIPSSSFYHVEASCPTMPCPPYDNQKELNCVVCTK